MLRLLTRRVFLQSSGLAAAASVVPSAITAAALGNAQPEAPLEQFSYDAVTLGDGPALRQRDQTHRVLMGLSDDDLLRPFRVRAGIAAPGNDLGGWYAAGQFAPGHCFGQWLSALSRSYAANGDPQTRAKIDTLLRGYAETVEPTGKFFEHNRFPAYTYDKLVCGFIDAHTFARNPLAADALARTTDAVSAHLPGKAVRRWEGPASVEDQYERHSWDESYTLSENLFLAAERTGDRRYLTLATQYLYREDFFDPLARGENRLPGNHAYSHVNALGSAAKAYLVLNDPSLLQAAVNGHRFVREQSYATGGWGPDEHFIIPGSGRLGAGLTDQHHSFETPCGAYAHFKLSRYLLRITRDPLYGDSMEQVLYNTVLGAKPLQQDGRAFYYSDYTAHTHKTFHSDAWPCCSGTLPQVSADYGINAYLQDTNGVYVNLYLPSTVHWRSGSSAVEISQQGTYPMQGDIHFEIRVSKPVEFALRLRIPAWAGNAATVLVNGRQQAIPVNGGTFASIARKWKTGDRVELHLPMPLRLVPVDAQHPDLVALSCGPLVLFPVGDTKLATPSRADLLRAGKVASSGDEWEVQTTGGILRLQPFLSIDDQVYSTYIQVTA